MKKVNPHAVKAIIDIVLITLSVIAIALCFSGCNAEKRLEKAKQLVLTDKGSFEEVGKKFLDLNPCINIPIYKSDTINVHDTTMHFEHYTDSIHHTDTVKEIVTVTNTKIIKDTTTIIDGQQVKLLTESVIKKDLQIATMNGQIIGANNATKDAQSDRNKLKKI